MEDSVSRDSGVFLEGFEKDPVMDLVPSGRLFLWTTVCVLSILLLFDDVSFVFLQRLFFALTRL